VDDELSVERVDALTHADESETGPSARIDCEAADADRQGQRCDDGVTQSWGFHHLEICQTPRLPGAGPFDPDISPDHERGAGSQDNGRNNHYAHGM
jgi:hypothetical protein